MDGGIFREDEVHHSGDEKPAIARAALAGAGLIGRSWAIVFARAGVEAVLYDPKPGVAEASLAIVRGSLREMEEYGLVSDAAEVASRIRVASSLADAVSGADWVQESIPEVLEVKSAMFSRLHADAPRTAIFASSTSGFPPSVFTNELAGRERMLVAHPVNPPHLAPLVEIVPAPWTDPSVVSTAVEVMRAVGQQPVLVRKEIEGFILNRLQGAVLDEAFRLIEGGYVSVADLDRTMVYGLAPRWSFIGPFETIDLNAPGGVRDYAERYREMYHGFTVDRAGIARPWATEAVTAVDADRRSALPKEKIGERASWRDRELMRLAAERERAAAQRKKDES